MLNKLHYNINEVSKLLNIPKSTLHFWDSKNILKIHRKDNNYRVYTIDEIFELYFIKNYRELGFSIKEIIKMRHLNLEETYDFIKENEDIILNQITRLENSLCDIQQKKNNMENYLNFQYKISSPPFEYIEVISEDPLFFTNIERAYTKFSFVLSSINDLNIKFGLMSTKKTLKPVIWTLNNSTKYLECYIRILNKETLDTKHLQAHLDFIESIDKRAGHIVALFAFSCYENQLHDYYKCWIELLP